MFETWAVNFIHRQVLDLAAAPEIYHWRTSGGAEVDLLLERDRQYYPIEIKCKSKLSNHDTRGIRSFRETYKKILPGLIIYTGDRCYRINSLAIAVPWNATLPSSD